LALKTQMEQWALQMQASSRSTAKLNTGIELNKMLNQDL